VKNGYVASIDEAFDKYLGTDRPAYVDKYRIECEQAIRIIRAAGGFPVLAHPALLNIESDQKLDALLQNLVKIGLAGIEVYYPGHSPRQIRQYMQLADRCGLLMTGGTDFHGTITPEIKMGSGKGKLFIPYSLYEKLRDSRARI